MLGHQAEEERQGVRAEARTRRQHDSPYRRPQDAAEERRPYVYTHHNLAYNGCMGTYQPHELKQLKKRPPASQVVAFYYNWGKGGENVGYVSADWEGVQSHSSGRTYLCPCSCAAPAHATNCSAQAVRSLERGSEMREAARCPWG